MSELDVYALTYVCVLGNEKLEGNMYLERKLCREEQ